MTTSTIEGSSAHDRLLAAADELFYAEGVHAVGIDRVIERAGVAKASLYNVFGSKDELVKAYLEQRSAAIRARYTEGLKQYKTPRQKLIGIFELQGKSFGQPRFRGCAFIGASSESPRPGGPVEIAATEHRGWIRNLFLELSHQAGARRPTALAKQLTLVYDGATIAAWLDGDRAAAATARTVATTLVNAALD